ncbi:acetyltransferase [Sphingopyxis sp. MWB1]|uniref:acetyltransferase n=1 Tax=Sphingopyxis sp. MWB1 TaxID=1537715 RepID=UPI00051A68FE|nr:acetyltransferase [Sphingopyxis sp. MWB1]
MRQLYGIYGAGGCGRGVMPLLAEQAEGAVELVFVDDSGKADRVNGYPVWTWEAFLMQTDREKAIAIAIANSEIREQINRKRQGAAVGLIDVISRNSVVMDDVEIGPGCLISPFVTMTSNIRIGSHFHCNIGSYVEHDCRIGNYVTFAPGVRCNGNVHIGDHAYVGSGAILRNGNADKPLVIGAGAVVGMGAVVTRDVASGSVVAGNPAREMAPKV